MINHLSIPIIYEVMEDEKFYYIVEKYFEGNTLYEVVKKNGPMQENLVIEYGITLSCILEYLHFNSPCSVVHLDIQPKNIVVRGKELFLIDFGNGYLKKMSKKNIFGTKGFVAPELYSEDFEKIDGKKADIYSLGSVLLYLLTGKTLLGGAVKALLNKACVSKGLCEIIEKSLEYQLEHRQLNVSIMKEQLLSLRTKQKIRGCKNNYK